MATRGYQKIAASLALCAMALVPQRGGSPLAAGAREGKTASAYDIPATPAARAPRAPKPALTPGDETLTRLIRLRSRLRNLDMNWVKRDGDDVMDRFTATLGGGRVDAACHINWSRPESDHWAKIRLDHVGVADFLQAADIRLDARIDARISGELDLHWSGLRVRQMRPSLGGKGAFRIHEGAITSTAILDSFADFTEIPALRSFQFTGGTLVAAAQGGRLDVSEFRLAGPSMRVDAKGTVDLDTDDLRVRFNLEVLPALAGQSSRFEVREGVLLMTRLAGKDADKDFVRVPLPFAFAGTLAKPVAVLDLGQKEQE
jgi:hypothetical protein